MIRKCKLKYFVAEKVYECNCVIFYDLYENKMNDTLAFLILSGTHVYQ